MIMVYGNIKASKLYTWGLECNQNTGAMYYSRVTKTNQQVRLLLAIIVWKRPPS